jgi:hypothetical protein
MRKTGYSVMVSGGDATVPEVDRFLRKAVSKDILRREGEESFFSRAYRPVSMVKKVISSATKEIT